MEKKIVEKCPDALGNEISIGTRVLFVPSGGSWRFGVGIVTSITWEWNKYRDVDMYQVGIKTPHGQKTTKSNLGVIKAEKINDDLLD